MSVPISVKHSVNPKDVPLKRIFKPPNLEPRRLKNYIHYINYCVDSVDDLLIFEERLAESAKLGVEGLLENSEASIEESDEENSYNEHNDPNSDGDNEHNDPYSDEDNGYNEYNDSISDDTFDGF